jgi:hypothetical protein
MAELHTPGHSEHVEVHHVDHEESDVNINAILGFGAALVAAAVIISLLTFVLFRFFDVREGRPREAEYPLAVAQENRVPPEPRLQTDPRQDLSDLRASEDALLDSYGWVDRNAGVVRIPIDEAIRLTLERGLPARQESR